MEQRLEKQAEEMARAAREMSEAARELTRAVERLAEYRHTGGSTLMGMLGSGGMAEEEAVRVALDAVHRSRSNDPDKDPEALAPDADQIRARREERRRREFT